MSPRRRRVKDIIGVKQVNNELTAVGMHCWNTMNTLLPGKGMKYFVKLKSRVKGS
jgi:hypothetical protein